MTAQVTINPILTTNAQGSFNVQTTGYIQGTALADPAVRNALAGGVLASSETVPMWGGVGISEGISATPGLPSGSLGGPITRATNISAVGAAGSLTGFSVFDQDHAMINSPQSPVPLAATGMMVNFYRLGSGARIAVKCDPSLVSLEGGIITQLVTWDFGGQQLAPYVGSYPANVFTSMSWASAGGGTVTGTTTSAHGIVAGDDFTIIGVVPTAYNGNYVALAGTTGSTIKFALASNPGAVTTQGSLVAGGGALPVRVLDVQVGNSMTVTFDPVTGFATWNRSGTTAIILI